jgi:2',3'-cyclic-nucleotide 2'-phosphodiesterase / 3'-nucleotidase / 5'-nucleotidase
VAVEATPQRTAPGKVVFFNTDMVYLSHVTVGAVPDMLTFTHRGSYVLVANEGEPSGYAAGDVDPEGSVSIINMKKGAAFVTQADVRTASFAAYNGSEATLNAAGIRIFGPGASASKDLEPEYLAVSPDDTTAWVTLQENNALAKIDIEAAQVTLLIPLGLKDHSLPGNELDASDRDSAVRIVNQPLFGMYQPDTIAAFPIGNQVYLFTANEGDAREWGTFREDRFRVADAGYVLDPTAFPNAATIKANANLGRLRISASSGDLDGDGDFDQIHGFGARSFSIRTTSGALVYDSGDAFERITAATPGVVFNASHDNNTFDTRSPSKGPDPEALAVGRAFQRTWALIGLERVGGVMVYDVSQPASPRFVNYVNNRAFASPFSFATEGDLGPECVLFIEEGNSPTGEPLVVIANEISGTTSIYAFEKVEN